MIYKTFYKNAKELKISRLSSLDNFRIFLYKLYIKNVLPHSFYFIIDTVTVTDSVTLSAPLVAVRV
jgi:hypothetical protein